MEITLHTGHGDCNLIYVDWRDHNNVQQETRVGIDIGGDDKDRQIIISVNGVIVATVPAQLP